MSAAEVFSMRAARAARDDAVERVDTHAEVEWKAAAAEAIEYVARRRPELTTDAVWYLLDHAGIAEPHERRALGPRMQAAARAGWIEPTDRRRNSIRAACHTRELRIWRSLIVEAPA